MNIKALLEQKSRIHGAKAALIHREQKISFEEMLKQTLQLTRAFQFRGIGAQDHIAVYLPNCPEYILAYFATFCMGATIVPLDFMLTETELIKFIQHSHASILFTRTKRDINLEVIKRECPSIRNIICCDPQAEGVRGVPDLVPYRDLMETGQNHDRETEYQSADPAAIFYTSGSTGRPKGVLLTYAHLNNPVACIRHFLNPSMDDSYLCAGIPFSHLGGLDYILFMLSFGSTMILMERFQPLETLRYIERYRPTIFCIVPSMFVALLSMKEVENFNLTSLRHLVVFGAPSSPVLLKRFHQLCPNARLSNGWGMTETAAPNTYSPENPSKINSIGPFGIGMEAKLVDDKGQTVPEGQQGELWVRGQAVMAGYYQDDELTRQTLTSDGWLKTGDIARKDEDGNFYLTGRKKEMIKVAGEIVMAPEVEDILHQHPDIAEAAVIGSPDALRGEVPRAYVVLREGRTLGVADLRDFIKQHLAHFKIPASIDVLDALPKNRVGKVDKEALKQMFSETTGIPERKGNQV